MANYVDAKHLEPMILSNQIEVLPERFSKAAKQYLEMGFPLQSKSTTQILNWEALPSTSIDWMTATDEATLSWAASTIVGQCEFAILLFQSDQPCLIGRTRFMVRHLDELVWGAPGARLLFGVNRAEDEEVTFTRGVIEFDGRSRLYASVAPLVAHGNAPSS